MSKTIIAMIKIIVILGKGYHILPIKISNYVMSHLTIRVHVKYNRSLTEFMTVGPRLLIIQGFLHLTILSRGSVVAPRPTHGQTTSIMQN